MKRKIAIILTVLLVSIGVSALPSHADSRLSISASSGAVLTGTGSTFTIKSSVNDFPSEDWANVKYEVITPFASGPTATATVQQLRSEICHGTAGANVNYLRPCTTEIRSGRTVLNAGAPSESNLYLSTLKLTPLTGQASIFQVRAWLDRDSNGLIDPFEPVSNTSKLQSVDAAKAKSFINFQVEPPLIQKNSLKAWVSAGSSAAVVGGMTTVGGLIDPSLLTVQILNCKQVPCTVVSSSGTWNPGTLQKQFEYTSTQSFSHGAKLTFNLFYNPYSDSSLKTAVKLATKSFDYEGGLPHSIQTGLTSIGVSAGDEIASGNYMFHNQRQNFAEYNVKAFTYKTRVTGQNSRPLANRDVYLNVDLHGLSAWSGIKVDGVSLTSVLNDRVILKRTTDDNGEVEVQFQVPDQVAGSQLEIDAIISGLRAHEISGDGLEEVLIWKSDMKRFLSLSFATASSKNGSGLQIDARVRNGEGDMIAGERVIFSSDGDLEFSNAMPVLSGVGSASTVVRVSPMAKRSGSGYITAQMVSAGQILEKKVLVSWDSFGAGMWASQGITSALANQVTYSGVKFASPGSSLAATLRVRNAGGGLAKNEPVRLKLTGPGKLIVAPAATDKSGALNFKIQFGSNDLGSSKLTAYLPASGVYKHFRVLTGVLATVAPVGLKAKVTVNSVKGSVVTVYVNDSLEYTNTATSDSYSFETLQQGSGLRKFKVFVDGVKVLESTLAFP